MKHTIDTLTTDFKKFKTEVNKRFDTMQPQVQEMHDYIIKQEGFEAGQLSVNNKGSVSISKDVWSLIIKLVLIIAAILGIGQLPR